MINHLSSVISAPGREEVLGGTAVNGATTLPVKSSPSSFTSRCIVQY